MTSQWKLRNQGEDVTLQSSMWQHVTALLRTRGGANQERGGGRHALLLMMYCIVLGNGVWADRLNACNG